MATASGGESFLVQQFDDFYREVIHLSELAQTGGSAPPQSSAGLFSLPGDTLGKHASVRATDFNEPVPFTGVTPGSVRQRLLTVLERQALDVHRSGGDYAAALYKEAQYVMAALADEVFLYLDWPGSEDWSSSMLESALFESHRAGEEIFEQIERLVRERNPVYRDLAKIYLMALGLGFQGRYRGTEDGVYQIAQAKARLFEFLAGEEPELRNGAALVPEAYASTLSEGTAARLPYLKIWTAAFGVVLLLWLLAGQGLWRALVSPLEPTIEEILSGR